MNEPERVARLAARSIMHRARRSASGACLLLGATLLTACASVSSDRIDRPTEKHPPFPRPPVSAPVTVGAPIIVLAGRMSVRVESEAGAEHTSTPRRAYAGAFDFAGSAVSGRLTLGSPLGTTVAQAHWGADAAELITSESVRRFPDTQALAREALGESLPLPSFIHWLQGEPDPTLPFLTFPPPAAGFQQAGWVVDLSRFNSGVVSMQRESPPRVSVQVHLDSPAQ